MVDNRTYRKKKDIPSAFWLFVLDLRLAHPRGAHEIASEVWEGRLDGHVENSQNRSGFEIKNSYKNFREEMKAVSIISINSFTML